MQALHRCRWLLLVACLLTLGLFNVVQAQEDKPLDRKEIDKRIYEVLRDVINAGADLYNPPTNDRAGCYRLYLGALMTVKPLLDHRAKLQEAIDAGITKAEGESSAGAKAFALRKVIDQVRAEVQPGVAAAKPALWERLGGDKTVAKVIDDFVELAAKNPKANFSRDGKFKPDEARMKELKKLLLELVSSATGGPHKYTGKSMLEVHKDMKITDAEFDAMADDLKKALKDNSVKEEDAAELLKIVEDTRKEIVGGKKPDDTKPEDKSGQVKGKVIMKDKPMVGVTVTFINLEDPKDKGVTAVTLDDGTYEVKGGLKPGGYRVTIKDGEKKAGVPEKYTDAKTSGLVIDVKKGVNDFTTDLIP